MPVSAGTIDDLLSPEAFAAVRRAPTFRQAAEQLAAGALEEDRKLDAATRWLTKDIGRISLYLSTLIIHATLGRVSVQDLATAAAYNATCSRGRVIAYIEYAQAAGRIRVPMGEAHWPQRPLTLNPSFIDYGRARFWREMEGAALVAPEAAAALSLRPNDELFTAGLVMIGRISVQRRDLLSTASPSLSIFFQREAAMRILYEWLGRQQPVREQLLESAPLKRTELSRAYGISRAHLNQLLADATSQGLLTSPSPDRVCFTTLLSTQLEEYFSFLIQVSRLGALAGMEG